jgi:hypothetical protein
MILVRQNGKQLTQREAPHLWSIDEIIGFLGDKWHIVCTKKVNNIVHRVLVNTEAQKNVPNMVASKMAGRMVCGDVLFLLRGVEIS